MTVYLRTAVPNGRSPTRDHNWTAHRAALIIGACLSAHTDG